ncbi:MAG: TetR/AcrR family transcriptional regulator [Actinobacteria bacterium]|nr:TetR/AcrR family transcriptional regulator [Actinomycetota bacterium]
MQYRAPPMDAEDRQLTPRGEERRRQLMAFAAQRFAENGYHPTSVAEIVEGLGVGKGVFYWYFDSKDDLLAAILSDGQRDLRRRQRDAIAEAATPLDRVRRGVRASIEWSLEQPVLFRLFQFAATDERFAGRLRKGEQIAVADAARHIQDAIDAGEIPDADATVLAHAMVGVHTRLVHLVATGQVERSDEIIDTAVDFCVNGISGPHLT